MMLPGWPVERFGTLRVAAIGPAFCSVRQILPSAAADFGAMPLARLGIDAGAAPSIPVSYRSARERAPYSEGGLAVPLIGSGTLIRPALTAPAVARLVAETSWCWSSRPPSPRCFAARISERRWSESWQIRLSHNLRMFPARLGLSRCYE